MLYLKVFNCLGPSEGEAPVKWRWCRGRTRVLAMDDSNAGATDNSGFAHRSSLRSPCRISLLAKLDVTAEDCAPAIERIQRVSDTDICIAIAKELSQRTSEPYLVELSTKRYLQQRPLKMRDTDCGMRMSFFVARADS